MRKNSFVLAGFQSGHNCGLNSKKYLADEVAHSYTKYNFLELETRYDFFMSTESTELCSLPLHSSIFTILLLTVRKNPSTALRKKNYCLL